MGRRKPISSLSPEGSNSSEKNNKDHHNDQWEENGELNLMNLIDNTGLLNKITNILQKPPVSCFARLLADINPNDPNLDVERLKKSFQNFISEIKNLPIPPFKEEIDQLIQLSTSISMRTIFFIYFPWIFALLVIVWLLVLFSLIPISVGLILSIGLILLVWLFLYLYKKSLESEIRSRLTKMGDLLLQYLEKIDNTHNRLLCLGSKAACDYTNEDFDCSELPILPRLTELISFLKKRE